jgi:inorganic triphosphatase YgiF
VKNFSRELELKFVLTAEQIDRAKSALPKLGSRHGKAVTQTLRSTYFDTPDCILHGNGLSLRVRQSGSRLSQTLKAETGVNGGLSNPVELETPIQGRVANIDVIPDKAVRKEVRKLIGTKKLQPLFETVVERTTQQLETPEGAKLELALDKGVVKTADDATDVCEAELELKAGSPESLLRLVDQLFVDEVPKPSERNKPSIGYGLLNGKTQPRLEPLKPALPKLKKRSNGAAALALILQTVTGQILHNWAVVIESDDPEGVHQLRVGLRRLRTALKAFKPIIKNGSLFDMEDRLRDFAHLVGELRDADVQATDIVKPVQEHRDWDLSVEPLAELLAKRRIEIRTRVRQALQGKDLLKLRLQIALLPALVARPRSPELKRKASLPVRLLAEDALKKMWRKVVKRARQIDRLNIEERHALRKDLKALRYTVEFFSGLFPAKKVKRFTTKLEELQDLFGYMNDVAGAQHLAQALTKDDAQDSQARQAIGYVVGWHTAKAEDVWVNARASWKQLKVTPRFWT